MTNTYGICCCQSKDSGVGVYFQLDYYVNVFSLGVFFDEFDVHTGYQFDVVLGYQQQEQQQKF